MLPFVFSLVSVSSNAGTSDVWSDVPAVDFPGRPGATACITEDYLPVVVVVVP